MKPEEVAQRFVPNEFFYQLTGNNHVVLLGPRGSGKTTMMKMLTQRALNTWDNQIAIRLNSVLPFCAVYIPTDVHWDEQIKYCEEQLERYPTFRHQLSISLVTLNILDALVTTMEDRIKFELQNIWSKNAEEELCQLLVSYWLLPPTIPRLTAIRLAVQARFSDTIRIANRIMQSKTTIEESIDLPEYFFMDYFANIRTSCLAFDTIFPQDNLRKWALCFDELELAPEWLQQDLATKLRSTDERFLFKLSTCPFPGFLENTKASLNNDYDIIRLWPHKENKAKFFIFSNELVGALLNRHGIINKKPADVLGRSPYVQLNEDSEQIPYEEGSEEWDIIREAAEWDSSLRRLLESKGIPPDNPTTADQTKRDSILRKIKPTVILRNEFMKHRDGRISGRSRKRPTVYSGVEAIYDICDGNPRRLIKIIDDMITEASVGKEKIKTIPTRVQAKVLQQSAKAYVALIKSLPKVLIQNEMGKSIHLYSLIESIGKYFEDRIYSVDFPFDPVGTFIVDSDWTPQSVTTMLNTAAYHGAIIHVNPDDDVGDYELTGKRFRLAYILSMLWRLPLRLNNEVKLSNCLKTTLPIVKEWETPGQASLSLEEQQ